MFGDALPLLQRCRSSPVHPLVLIKWVFRLEVAINLGARIPEQELFGKRGERFGFTCFVISAAMRVPVVDVPEECSPVMILAPVTQQRFLIRVRCQGSRSALPQAAFEPIRAWQCLRLVCPTRKRRGAVDQLRSQQRWRGLRARHHRLCHTPFPRNFGAKRRSIAVGRRRACIQQCSRRATHAPSANASQWRHRFQSRTGLRKHTDNRS